VTLRIKVSPSKPLPANITVTNESFDSLIDKEIAAQKITKVWICGPPKMNESLSEKLSQKYSK
jgi:predicted ferric reductase